MTRTSPCYFPVCHFQCQCSSQFLPKLASQTISSLYLKKKKKISSLPLVNLEFQKAWTDPLLKVIESETTHIYHLQCLYRSPCNWFFFLLLLQTRFGLNMHPNCFSRFSHMDKIEIAPASWKGSQRLHMQIRSAIEFVKVLLNFQQALRQHS